MLQQIPECQDSQWQRSCWLDEDAYAIYAIFKYCIIKNYSNEFFIAYPRVKIFQPAPEWTRRFNQGDDVLAREARTSRDEPTSRYLRAKLRVTE